MSQEAEETALLGSMNRRLQQQIRFLKTISKAVKEQKTLLPRCCSGRAARSLNALSCLNEAT